MHDLREAAKALLSHWDTGKRIGGALEVLRAALAADEVSAWQPIETAPRDGNYVLLATPKGRMADGNFVNYGVWAWPYVMVEPTHWMPLPGRPTIDAALAREEKS